MNLPSASLECSSLIVLVKNNKMASDRVICFGTFLASCAAIALLCGSLASQHWVVSTAHRVRKGKQDLFTTINDEYVI